MFWSIGQVFSSSFVHLCWVYTCFSTMAENEYILSINRNYLIWLWNTVHVAWHWTSRSAGNCKTSTRWIFKFEFIFIDKIHSIEFRQEEANHRYKCIEYQTEGEESRLMIGIKHRWVRWEKNHPNKHGRRYWDKYIPENMSKQLLELESQAYSKKRVYTSFGSFCPQCVRQSLAEYQGIVPTNLMVSSFFSTV